jgi:hypothetical protein
VFPENVLSLPQAIHRRCGSIVDGVVVVVVVGVQKSRPEQVFVVVVVVWGATSPNK